MKTVKFTKDHQGQYKKKGDVGTYDDAIADSLIRHEYAEKVEEKPEKKEAKADTK